MKKFYYLLASIAIILVTIIACEKSAIEVDDLQTIKDEELSSKTDKVRLCHWDATSGGYITRAISQKAAQAHLKHGDKYLYSVKEEWAIIKENIDNHVIHLWDVNVYIFDGTYFYGEGNYQWWPDGSFNPSFLRIEGTVNSFGIMDITLVWSTVYLGLGPTFHFGGTACMCSGIYEVHSFGSLQRHQFRLDQPLFPPCQTYTIP